MVAGDIDCRFKLNYKDQFCVFLVDFQTSYLPCIISRVKLESRANRVNVDLQDPR